MVSKRAEKLTSFLQSLKPGDKVAACRKDGSLYGTKRNRKDNCCGNNQIRYL